MNETKAKKYFVRATIDMNAIATAIDSNDAITAIFDEITGKIETLNSEYKGKIVFKFNPLMATASEMPE